MSNIPKINGIAETVLYVDDLDRSREFYSRLFGFELTMKNARGIAFAVGDDVLLLFKKGGSVEPAVLAGGAIPPHDADGHIHMAFAVSVDALEAWRLRLEELGVEIESSVDWARGGKSLYFRDPDHHCIELVTPGTWKNY